MQYWRHLFLIVVAASSLAVVSVIAQSPESPSNEAKVVGTWAAVEKAVSEGLPKTAIENLEPIIAKAKEAERYDEAIKAVAMKVNLEGQIQGGLLQEKIVRMRAVIDESPAPMKPVLEAILANWYWHYFQQNRWRFQQRSETATPPSDDFTTWDLTRILQEVDRQFDAALTDSDVLKATRVEDYDELLAKGTMPTVYRPTLYDVIVFNALEFYAAGEQVTVRPQDPFVLRTDSPIFAGRAEFTAWTPQTTDGDSLILRAVELYQKLLRFHADDDNKSALLDADLYRLQFGEANAVGDDKADRYKSALRRLEEGNARHEISSRILFRLAEVIHGEGDWAEAHKIASEGLARFRNSVGADQCYNLIQQIEARSLAVSTERVWNEPWSTIDVQYRNVDKVHFRLVQFRFDDFVESDRWRPDALNDEQLNRLLRAQPVRTWSHDLAKTENYKQRLEQVEIPRGLPAGSYYLIASDDANFIKGKSQISLTEVWISNLAMIIRHASTDGTVGGFILNAKTGVPIRGATIRAWHRTNRNRVVEVPATTTDERGRFEFQPMDRTRFLIHASHGGQSLSSANVINTYRQSAPTRSDRFQQTRFFTDRAIYRPGQTIQYKGVCIGYEKDIDHYETLANRDVTVVFADANGKEIERRSHRTNAYGSFSGSVTAPRDRLMGSMRLYVENGIDGQTMVQVEEYKRPKFRVEVDMPKEAAKLGGDVTVAGKATAYTGVAISDAVVQWRVVRNVEYPIWWYWSRWWMPPMPSQGEEIAHGTAITDATGKFTIPFVAQPDESVDKESEPTFRFQVYADVTDTTGETRSDSITVNVGYTALRASMSADDWLTSDDPIAVRIRTESLDGESRAAQGSVKIHSLQQPESVIRPTLADSRNPFVFGPESDEKPEPKITSDPTTWALGEVVFESDFATDGSGTTSIEAPLKAGLYRAVLETRDEFGKEIKALLPLHVIDPSANQFAGMLPSFFKSKSATVEVGETYIALWGSGYASARAYVEVEHRGKLLQSFWTEPNVTQIKIRQEVTEAMRGGFTVRVTMVHENRVHFHSQRVAVPWSNKELTIEWERFTSKLEPAQQEKWSAIIKGPEAEKAAAEMVATLYDASLDAFMGHHWANGFGVFRKDYSQVSMSFQNDYKHLNVAWQGWPNDYRSVNITYAHLPPNIIYSFLERMYRGERVGRAMMSKGMAFGAAPTPMAAMADADPFAGELALDGGMGGGMGGMSGGVAGANQVADAAEEASSIPDVDLTNVSARKNLNETAFFFPHVISGEDGIVRLEFTMPEALTEWKFMGFAHDPKLRAGLLTDTVVSSKDLMIQPNPPRFLREGDVIEFTVKVSNKSATAQTGVVRLEIRDARTNESVDAKLENNDRDKAFDLPAGESKTFAWRLSVPEGIGYLTYKAIGSSGRLSDGEEGFLPVLSKRVLVTESIALPIRGKETKEFEFEKLLASAESKTLKHQSLTIQMVSNPSWYAVMALPYLMEFPHECSEQVFNRLYANALARHIAMSDQKIEAVFAQWRGTPALDSPLAKNEDLKMVMLEETPWYADAQDESQARRNVGILFEQNRLTGELERAMVKLGETQLDDGMWPWFPDGYGNEYITLYITTGFGRLRHLGVDVDAGLAIRSLNQLDAWMTERYNKIGVSNRSKNHLSPTVAIYLYGRSFFLEDQPIADQHKAAVDYWLSQAKKFWLEVGNRQSQAHLSLALKRFGDQETAMKIVNSIREFSVTDEELGMFWRDQEASWWWFRAPIETQAMMIEMFDEVANDRKAVEDCKVWLLKQKQTRDWKTTKATADAVYSLMLRGSDLLASNELVKVSLGGDEIVPENVEAGTGFYAQRFAGGEIVPQQGQVSVTKVDDGVAWGSLHWQYLEDIGEVTPHEGTPLKLSKDLYVKQNTASGPQLSKVDGPVAVGDELVVRIVLRTDRDMEYIHMKDHRGSGTEPVNVISRYKYQDGLAYYESTRDTATDFFIDYLPKGTYVFEYSTRVQLRGEYETGMATIQCMYAPEFNSHSESISLQVR